MPIEILMPALSPTMTEGNVAKWHKSVGDTVTAGDIIVEIETDKATMEVEAVDEGTMGKILIAEGAEGVAVNTPIAILLGDGEDSAVLDTPVAAQPPAPVATPVRADSSAPAAPPRPPRHRRAMRIGSTKRPPPRPCARPCATPWPRRCVAIRPSS